MIELKNLSKTYVNKNKIETRALKNVNAKFHNNETTFIIGPSGSGKTTLLNCIGAFDSIDDGGSLNVNKKTINNLKQTKLDNYRNYKVGYVFQENNLLDHLTALENVELSLLFSKSNPKLRKKLAKEALKKVGMQDFAKKYPNELSLGQCQCVAVARAIAKNPEIILADEPTGSLDTKNSKMILDVLKSVSKNSTLIIATHNENLAKKYADKIYELIDGEFNPIPVYDAKSNVYEHKESQNNELPSSTQILDKNNIKTEKSTFSVYLAFKLAFSSLLSKKIKTAFMVLAGSIGVFLVATILAFSTGLNGYITNMQNNTLAQYPLFFSQTRDLSKVESYVAHQNSQTEIQHNEYITKQELKEKTIEDARASKRAALNSILGSFMSTNGNPTSQNDKTSTKNDLKSFKEFLDKNPDDINNFTSSIEYTYRTSPVIFSDTENEQSEVFPEDGLFGSLGSGSSKISITGASSKEGTSSANTISRMFTTFGPLPKNKEVYQDDESLVAGKWPETPYDLVLVLNSDGTIDDTILYELGMRNFDKEIEPLLEKYKNGEKVDFPGQFDTYAYSEFLGKTYKMINPSDCFVYDSSQGVYTDNSSDPDFMKGILAKAKPLTIVGVVLPADNSRADSYLMPGINFSYDLYEESINQTKNSEVVKAQLAHPDIDVLSGEKFDYLSQADKITDKLHGKKLLHFDLDSLLQSIKIHPEALDFSLPDRTKIITEKDEIDLMIKILQDPKFQEMIYDLIQDGKFEDDVYALTAQATQEYLEYVKDCEIHGDVPESPEDWFKDPFGGEPIIREICEQLPQDMVEDAIEFIKKHGPSIVDALINEISAELEEVIKDLMTVLFDESRPGLIEFDINKFSSAIGTDITLEDLKQIGLFLGGATSHTYLGNLSDFGYDEMIDPIAITIYPKDYESKTIITDIIQNYNNDTKLNNQESKFVTYTDDASTTIELGRTVIAAITAILIFLISFTFITSTLLIGVIFGVSTVRRRREIGIIRALGARRKDITRMFNCESALVGFLSGLLGIFLSAFACSMANASMHLGFNIAVLAPWIIVVLIVVSVMFSIIAGLIPAVVSSTNDPVKAIRGL